jgi:carboxyvinyl-carboxyphosphonate phosphorylmutase
MVWHGVVVETMIALIRAGLARAETITGAPSYLANVTAELSDREYLAKRGVRVCLQGHQPFAAAVRALYETLKVLRQLAAPSHFLRSRLRNCSSR